MINSSPGVGIVISSFDAVQYEGTMFIGTYNSSDDSFDSVDYLDNDFVGVVFSFQVLLTKKTLNHNQ